jgi:hypothetical protein
MAQFKAFAPGVQVNGESVLSVVDGMGAFKSKAEKILAQNTIVDVKPGCWYSQQAWLDAFKDISEVLGVHTLFAIGKSIPRNAKFPPGINTIPAALSSIDVAYHMNHRGGAIGDFAVTQSNDRSAVLVCRNPYPCDFDRGVITGTADRFKPPHTSVRVVHDDRKPCRKEGADSCTFLVSW